MRFYHLDLVNYCGLIPFLLEKILKLPLHLELCYHGNVSVAVEESKDDDDEKAKPSKFVTESKVTSFGFGVRQNYVFLKPMFQSLREEMQCCADGGVSHEIFLRILKKAIHTFGVMLKKGTNTMSSREYADEYGILRNQHVTMMHVMAMISYTDLSKFCISTYSWPHLSL